MLTDKALTDFNKWLENNYDLIIKDVCNLSDFKNCLPWVCEYALMVEWFDTVGINVNVTPVIYRNWGAVKFLHGIIAYKNNTYDAQSNRQEATKQALIMANGIYNSKK